MKYKKCNLCLSSDQKLVKSHIIPRAFYKDIKGDKNLYMIDNQGSFPKKAPCGVYDRIVCAECEKKFGYGDNYIRELINNGFSIFGEGKDKAHIYKNPDVGIGPGFVLK